MKSHLAKLPLKMLRLVPVKGIIRVRDNNTHESQNQAAELFGLVFSRCTDGLLEVRAPHQDKTHQRFLSLPSEIMQAAKFAVGLRDEIFFGVGGRSETKGTADCITALPVLWIDADDNAIPWPNLPLELLAIVDSGHSSGKHFHAYYALNSPYELTTQAHRARALAFLKGYVLLSMATTGLVTWHVCCEFPARLTLKLESFVPS